MNRTKLKNYAPQARRDFIQAMTDRAAFYGLTAKKIEPVVERGDVAVIAGREHPRAVAKKRKQLEERIRRHGFDADDGGAGLHMVQPAGRHPVHGTARLPRPRLPGLEPPRRTSRRRKSSNTPSMSNCRG